MDLVKTIVREAVGLFVADIRFVVSVLIWIVAVVYGLRGGLLSPALAAILLALGVALLLVFDVLRAARAPLRRK